MRKKILWIVAGILAICTVGMQIPEFDADFQNWFSTISGILTLLFASATLPKIGEKYLAIIRLLMQALAKLFRLRKEKKKDEVEKV